MEKQKNDGMKALINKLGDDTFIKLAVENSYFFSAEVVECRQLELNTLLQQGKALPARKTTKTTNTSNYWQTDGYYCENNVRILINQDSDGNREVRRLINKETGYVVANGKNSDFINYVISHVWGRAYDPRYFTSLWNIVLIPAWANSLMDKDAQKGTLESLFQSTIKQICCELYKDVNKGIGNFEPEFPIETDDVTHGNFTINLLQKKGKGSPNPSIYTISI